MFYFVIIYIHVQVGRCIRENQQSLLSISRDFSLTMTINVEILGVL